MSRRFDHLVCTLVLLGALPALAHAQRGRGGAGPARGPSMGAQRLPRSTGIGPREAMRPSIDRGEMTMRSVPSRAPGIGAVHSPQLGPPGRWWDDKKVSRSLSLRPDQQHRMDDIFEANKGQLVSLYENLQREEQRLATMSSADLQDESKVFAGIDRVAQARAELFKENAHILLQIRHELDGDQLTRLDKETASAR